MKAVKQSKKDRGGLVHVKRDLHIKLKVHCAMNPGTSVETEVNEAVLDRLKKLGALK